MWGELHEEKEVVVTLPEPMRAGKGNRLFRELGAILYYDVYGFPAPDYEDWQSETLLGVTLQLDGNEVDAQEDFSVIRLEYLLASRPSSDQQGALNLIGQIIEKFEGEAIYQGREFVASVVQRDWDLCTDFLLKEWGEEPGSESLARMIEENYT